MYRSLFSLIVLAFSLYLSPATQARVDLEIVVPYSQGGSADIAARLLAQFLSSEAFDEIAVTNIVGNGGKLGSNEIHKAKPDGQRLLIGRIGSISAPAALGLDMPYAYDDFSMIGLIEINPMVCSVKATSAFTSIQALLTYVQKQRAPKLRIATAGFGTSQHLTPLLLLELAGISDPVNSVDVQHLNGGLAATNAVLNGQADLICNPLSAAFGAILKGQLRPLLVNTPSPHSKLPDVPIASSLGYNRLEKLVGWSALFGPPNMPYELVAEFSGYLMELGENDRWRHLVTETGSLVTILPPEQTRDFVEKQFEVIRELSTRLNLSR